MKFDTQRGNRDSAPDGQYYESSADDPLALRYSCPICPADVGEWCGGINDIHAEREALVPE